MAFPPNVPQVKTPGQRLVEAAPVAGLVVIVVVLVLLIVALLGSPGPLQRLADQAYARGAITFLVMVGTIGMALMLVASALFDTGMTDDRFRRAREVFGVLGGVLGTIVGFYFGTSTQEMRRLSLAEIQIIDVAGAKRVATHVTGGAAPFRYDIDLDDKPIIENRVSKDGWIVEPIAPKGVAFVVRVRVKDKNDATVETSYSSPRSQPGPDPGASPSPKPSSP